MRSHLPPGLLARIKFSRFLPPIPTYVYATPGQNAQRIAALAATGGNQILLEPQTIADQTSDAIVGVRASVDAGVAARAFL